MGKCICYWKGHKVTANSLIDSFDVVHSAGQLERELEADTYTYLCEFIHNMDNTGEIEKMSGYLFLRIIYVYWNIYFTHSIEGPMCVEDILKWVTGAKSVPPHGFITWLSIWVSMQTYNKHL